MTAAIAGTLLLLQGCRVGPKYIPPVVQAPPAFKEVAPQVAADGGPAPGGRDLRQQAVGLRQPALA